MNISVAKAKNRLCELLERAAKGERVTVTRHGKPIVDLVPSGDPEPPKKKADLLGAWIRGAL
jgi:prevent-host-death family protein